MRLSLPLALLLVLAFALRLGWCAQRTGLGQVRDDTYREYITLADRLLEHGTLLSPLIVEDISDAPSAMMPPLYVTLVAGVYRILGVDSRGSTLLLQCINAAAGTLCVLLVFGIACRLGGTNAAGAAGLLTALNPTLLEYTMLVWDTSLFTLGITATVWFALRLGDEPITLRRGLLYGLWLGLLALLNPALTIAYPVLVLWPLTRSLGWKPRRIVPPLVLVVCGWLIAITPWTIRNYVQLGRITYIRSGAPMELWLGFCPEADAAGNEVYRNRFPLFNASVQAFIADRGEEVFLQDCGRRAVEAIRADWPRVARLILRRTADYWLGSTFTHNPAGEGGWPRSLSRTVVMFFLGGEVLLAGACLLISRRGGSAMRWLLATALLFSITYCLLKAEVRFRAPSEPLIAIILAVSLVQAWATVRGRTTDIDDGATP